MENIICAEIYRLSNGKSYTYIEDFKNGFAVTHNCQKFGLIKYNGEEIVPCICDSQPQPSEGMIAVRINGQCGYYDYMGDIVITPKYETANEFLNGVAIVTTMVSRDKILPCLIDKQGKNIVSCFDKEHGYDKITYMVDDLYLVKRNQLYGIINSKGEILVEPLYLCIHEFIKEFAIVAFLPNKFGLINKKGIIVTKNQYAGIGEFIDGLAIVKNTDNTLGVINESGTEIVNNYDKITISKIEPFFIIASKLDKNNLFNRNGVPMVELDYYDSISEEHGEMRLVIKDGKRGYLNIFEEEEIPCIYDSASDFNNGLAHVVIDDVPNYIDKTGNYIMPMEYGISVDVAASLYAKTHYFSSLADLKKWKKAFENIINISSEKEDKEELGNAKFKK